MLACRGMAVHCNEVIETYAPHHNMTRFDMNQFSYFLDFAPRLHFYAQRAIDIFPDQQALLQQYVDTVVTSGKEVCMQAETAGRMRAPRIPKLVNVYKKSSSAVMELCFAYEELNEIVRGLVVVNPRLNEINQSSTCRESIFV
jgi:hypothetical protein